MAVEAGRVRSGAMLEGVLVMDVWMLLLGPAVMAALLGFVRLCDRI
ncbi:MAG: hypothetical protein AB7H88_15100 [Vicinamibacterales bacterium]